MSMIDRVRAAIHNMNGKFSVQEIVSVESSFNSNEASGILDRLYKNGEISRCEMVQRGRIRVRYYAKTPNIRQAKNLTEPIRKEIQRSIKPHDVKTCKGIIGIKIHRLGE